MTYHVEFANGSITSAAGDTPREAWSRLVADTDAGPDWEMFVDSLPATIGGEIFHVGDVEEQ